MIVSEPLQIVNGENAQGFDLSVQYSTLIYHVGRYATCAVQIVTDATTSIVAVQRSIDGKTRVDLETAQNVTGAGMTATMDCTGFTYLHVTVTTAQASKMADVFAIGKYSQ